ncbi:ribosomal protein L11 methyltransferase [Secundilactobacillus oryzae JCM 18671]|uniref:Ribosomal protein L11 methyltransferase n=1 Tax=Secundilactobacillus oryzae JCM 18671 TaxID=1291743 RepID=A0A081BHE2_9LACO|nr:50S ribosomal protein L11 methyltransferase [Secundilactobacillus oryzae]GAK47460.1 ribosomal protein L11 methyltransferase [Secundilactobacillus oryzae JCM 18671]
MKWTEIEVTTTSEVVEPVSNILMDEGASGVKIDDAKDFDNLEDGKFGELSGYIKKADIDHLNSGAKITAYYPETIFIPEILPTIKQRLGQLREFGLNPGNYQVETKEVAESDWATAWKKYYHPVRVTRFLTVVPSWEKYDTTVTDEKLIVLDPGMAFGTGTHPTTKLSLMALETVVRGGESMIDVGTGSGVLSIGAKQLGVGDVRAYDLDEVAVKAAQSNLDLNPVAKDIQVAANDLLNGIEEGAQIIVANILAEIILPLVLQAWDLLPENGYFLTSGIINKKFDEVVAAQEKQGFKIRQTLKMGDWYGIIAQKPGDDD